MSNHNFTAELTFKVDFSVPPTRDAASSADWAITWLKLTSPRFGVTSQVLPANLSAELTGVVLMCLERPDIWQESDAGWNESRFSTLDREEVVG